LFLSIKHVDKKLKKKRLTCDQPVGLRYTGYSIGVEKVIKDKDGQVLELIATCNKKLRLKSQMVSFNGLLMV